MHLLFSAEGLNLKSIGFFNQKVLFLSRLDMLINKSNPDKRIGICT